MPIAAPSSDLASPARLVVRGLACRRGERVLFEAIDLSLQRGEIVWLRGANGQGKTTLLRTLAGLAAPDAGSIAWNDAPGSRRPLYLGHANALKDDLSAAEALAFLLRLDGHEAGERAVDAALGRFGMQERARVPVRALSQGQRRRVALARLAAETESATWLLDEPFDALDASGSHSLGELLAEHARRGGSVVLTSHLPLALAAPVPREIVLEAPVAA